MSSSLCDDQTAYRAAKKGVCRVVVPGRAASALVDRRRHTTRAPMAISTNQFRNGTHIDVDGTVYKILEFQHVKPGKGGAFVRTRLRRASDGAVIDRTFGAGATFRPVRTETRRVQHRHQGGHGAHLTG